MFTLLKCGPLTFLHPSPDPTNHDGQYPNLSFPDVPLLFLKVFIYKYKEIVKMTRICKKKNEGKSIPGI